MTSTMPDPIPTSRSPRNRVPEIIFIYWVIKIAATTLGETGADMFSQTYAVGYGLTILLFMAVFGGVLAIKLATARYRPALYWAVFTASAIVGTAISDFIDRTLGVGYALGALGLLGVLLIVLGWWRQTEGSINVEVIRTGRAEGFYWLAFLVANTLGTAAGDYFADDLGIGFLTSAALIAGVLVGLIGLHFLTKVPGGILFWLAFVLTRPFGATFGDLLTKSSDAGGLDLGTVGTSVVFGVGLVAAVAYESRLERARPPAR